MRSGDISVSVTGSACNHVRERAKEPAVFKLKLGIIWQDGQIKNHRSLLKVVCNPILRMFGFEIATQARLPYSDPTTWKVVLRKYTGSTRNFLELLRGSWIYDGRYDHIQKQRRLW